MKTLTIGEADSDWIKEVSKDEVLILRNKLRSLGYQAKIANHDCFDIDQKGLIHYLSFAEATDLSKAKLPHPVALHGYADNDKTNSTIVWYNF